jgi:arabinofuranosyltransferase
MLAACLQTAVLWMALRAWKDRALSLPAAATLSVTAAAAILTRPDGAIVAGLGLLSAALVPFRPSSPARSAAERNPAGGKSASALASTERTSNQSPDTAVQGSLETADRGDRNAGGFERQSSGRRPMELAALALPAAAILGAWFVWKLSYYEALLPNTLAAKTGSSVPWAQGLAYLGIFFVSTWTFPVLFVTAAGFRRFTPPIVALVLTLAASFLYFVAVGGDFMEFRLFVPLLPILVLLVAWTVFRLVTQPEVRAALCVLVLGGWIHHAATFESARGVESIPTMVDHMSGPKGDWIGIGSRLGEIFEDARDVRIATSACGAIPFYSDLPVVDMLGLTDPWIPGHGVEIRREAGHTWVAPFSYLLKRRVNLVFGHPWVVTSSDPQELQPQRRGLAGFRYVVQIDPQELWSGSALLLIPLDAERSLAALYVTPHPAVERAIETNHWARFPLLGDVD